MRHMHLSIAQLASLFRDNAVSTRNGVTLIQADEDSPQEKFLRQVQIASHGKSRFMREFRTMSAAATPQYEFGFSTKSLQKSPNADAQKLGWLLENMLSETPYEFNA